MGLDYGSKTIGVAISDALGLTAQPLETIERSGENKLRRSLARIAEIVREKDIKKIVVGLPINMDGRSGERAALTLEFVEKLKLRVDIPIVMQDERLTTVEADEILDESGVKKQDRKQFIDQIAAGIILKEYMEKENGK
ncbi:Holliday junction resolvase RuvX [Lachnoanaerobaculum sp. Marseille-Q4761]|jgi:RNAse H domain protein, YqgF family|uniref:Holliday junction resolvase RuvX n=1 Tax=Lachnoanaerobaculum sp. Marseille-Q4761 TaxID=2819511 RepID=UPI001AA16D81|nr:Holliday junction resolvase RuvX [Lachnoanaerobaculum sp. Marseille-Q4761]MBO1869442.1 Holliday junction resolvase RuvX [Lachnoanaerobaculum sp. Marseille-Q4761]